MTPESESDLRLEIGHILFIDIVGYSKLLMEEQKDRLRQLTEIVLATPQVAGATNEQLVRLPTGDGMILAFRHSSEEPARCALAIAEALKAQPEIAIRMGIHSGPVSEVLDVSGRNNLAGAGINMAQRVMDCGDAGHILVSRRAAGDLEQYSHWQPHLHDLGECEVKHGARLGIVNLYRDGAGNSRLPQKLRAARQRQSRTRWGRIAAAVVCLGLLGAGAFFLQRKQTGERAAIPGAETASAQPVSRKSIAVLPFTDLSPAHDQSYFSDGMSEEILNALAQVEDLKVAGRTSSFYFKGKNEDLRIIGKALGVANVLEGSVRKQGEKVRITAQLIQALDGFHLFSDSYDGDLQDVFALQERIARAITDRLKITLSGEQKTQLVPVATNNTEAYGLYLQAREAYRARGGNVKRSIDLYHQALQLDPNFALAWAGLCSSLNVLPFYLPENEKERGPEIYREGEAAGQRAVALAPDLAAGHIALGGLYENAWHWRQAEDQYETARPLASADPEFYYSYTDTLGALGRTDEALQAAQRAVTLDPLAPAYRNLYGYILFFAGRVDEAIAQLEAGHAINPGMGYIEFNLFQAYVRAGRLTDADKLRASYRAALAARGESADQVGKQMAAIDGMIVIGRQPNDYAAIRETLKGNPHAAEISLAFPGHIDDLFGLAAYMIDGHVSGSDGVVILRSNLFAGHRQDPRYLRLLEKAGFDPDGVPR